MFMQKKLLLFSLFVISLVQAQGSKNFSFSLEEAIQHALTYNAQSINSGRDIAMAKQKKWETTTMGLPQINAGLEYQNNFVIQKNVVPAEFFGGNPGDFVEVAFGVKHSMNARATLSQLIFDGTYLVGLQAAKTYLEFYSNLKQKTDLNIRAEIINAYGQVLLLEENIEILKKNKKTLESNYFEANETFKNGLTEEETVEQIAITLGTINNALNNAKRLKDISYKMLKINLGLELEDEILLTDRLESLTAAQLDLALSSIEFNLDSNIDYLLGLNDTEQKRLLMLQEKSKALPSLSANFNFGYNAFNNEFQFFSRDQRWLNYSFVGASLNVPLFSSLGRSARTQQAKIALEKSKTDLSDISKKLQLQYQSAKSEYEYSIEEYFTNKSNLNLAERIEQKQQIKFKEGISSSFEFTEAQRQLYAAQQDYLQSMINVINKKAALEKILN
jgi:outer membrane protein